MLTEERLPIVSKCDVSKFETAAARQRVRQTREWLVVGGLALFGASAVFATSLAF